MRIFRWGCLLAVLIGVASVAAVAITVMRPARVIETDRDALANSLESELDGPEARCRRAPSEGDNLWTCSVETEDSGPGGPGAATYELRVSDWGCWETAGAGRNQLEDCIWLMDYVFN